MTREEAIYWIENLSGSWDGQYREARDMAISALREQEEYEVQRHLKHFDIKEPRAETVTNRNGFGWISVEERLPDSVYDVMTCRKNGHVQKNYMLVTGNWLYSSGCVNPITHWMPLPEPPEEEV